MVHSEEVLRRSLKWVPKQGLTDRGTWRTSYHDDQLGEVKDQTSLVPASGLTDRFEEECWKGAQKHWRTAPTSIKGTEGG